MSSRIIFLQAIICLLFSNCKPTPMNRVSAGAIVINPDYNNTVFPTNISPISFKIEQPADYYYLEYISEGKIIATQSSSTPNIQLSNEVWNKLKLANIFSCVITTFENGIWKEYKELNNYFSTDSIDPYLSYRLIAPGYELWNEMGIYQRDLTSFKEEYILTNKQTAGDCMNCHTYANYSTENMMIHLRGKNSGTLIKIDENIEKVQFNNENLISGCAYASWHPTTKYIAYSTNEINQYFHVTGNKPIEVADMASDIILYNISTNKIITNPIIHSTERLETFPEWSADGKTLYYTVATNGAKECPIDSIYYNLYALDFDVETERFFNERLLIEASKFKKSISFPKASPDGNYIVATMSDYGNFSIWHPEADLIIYSIKEETWRKIDEINSNNTESYHSFSSCGNWMVFSSRRDDGLFTVPYITHFNSEKGEFSKPFKLPQAKSDYYDKLFYSFNIPHFTKDRFSKQRELLRASKHSY